MFCFVSSNENKWKEVCEILGFKIKWEKVQIKEIQSLNLREILREKAKSSYEILKKPVVVEDVSLILNGYKNFPGPLIKWVIEGIGKHGIINLCRISKNFNAKAICCVCAYDGKSFNFFEGKINGKISKKPKGESGFGWDPLFIPAGFKKTFAEISMEEKNKISHRKKAWEKFKIFLEKKN